jgi:molybdenum cofactor guanylyltransferase
MDQIEAVLLTGGASSRMGEDKAKLLVHGEQLATRIARLLLEIGIPVTVCGREPLPGCAFLADTEEFAGPFVALSRFVPTRDMVFVASCDLPGFDAAIVPFLAQRIAGHSAAVPVVDGRMQPLSALYRANAFDVARQLAGEGERRMMRWIEHLDIELVPDIDPSWLLNANSPQDLPARDDRTMR